MMRQVLWRRSAGLLAPRLPYITSPAISSSVSGLWFISDSSSSSTTRRHDAFAIGGSTMSSQSYLPTRGFSNATDSSAKPNAVLVKVGDGQYSLVKLDLMEMDRMGLLEALAASRGFAVELRDVALGQCIVTACASASKNSPSEAEKASSCTLEGTETLGELASGMAAAAGTNLFVRVTLPGGSTTTSAGMAAQGELHA